MKVIDAGFGAGWQWLVAAARLFRAEPFRWAGLISLWFLTTGGMFLLAPPIGSLFALMFQPAFFAGLVIAARDQENGLPVTMGHLWMGFKTSGRALIGIGAVTMLAEIASLMLLVAMGFPQTIPLDAEQNPDVAAFAEMLKDKQLLIFLGFAMSAFIKGVFWFATPVLALKPMSAGHALRWSCYALIANFLPMALFAMMLSALFVLAMIPSGLGLLLFIPIYALTQYTSFKAVFRDDEPAEAAGN